MDVENRRVWRGDDEVLLSRKEFDLLHALLRRAGEIVTRDELMRDVWDTTFWTSSKTIDVHLGWVRRKLGDDGKQPFIISTIRGRGLRFETTARAESTDSEGDDSDDGDSDDPEAGHQPKQASA